MISFDLVCCNSFFPFYERFVRSPLSMMRHKEGVD